MKKDIKKMSLSRALLAGTLCGIITALLIAVYTYFYREDTDFSKIGILGPVTIFVGIPILLIIAGAIYFIMIHYISKGETWFILLFALLTFGGIIAEMNLSPSAGETLLSIPHGLLFGIEIITGLAICAFLPFLAHHPGIYMTPEQVKWEK